jgi:D-beta-D-heptose 7-phosphate kinase/D-beta-D-heptose 1-phosphate adenosyltransferase
MLLSTQSVRSVPTKRQFDAADACQPESVRPPLSSTRATDDGEGAFRGRRRRPARAPDLRVDQESAASLSEGVQHDLNRQLLSKLDRYQAIIISDYNKGVCAPRVVQAVIQAANERSIPIVVDPMRGRDYARYRRATILTPNSVEAEMATGDKIQQPLDALRLGRSLCDSLNLQAAAVTLGCEGIALALANGGGRLFPTKPRRVYDVAGAGDVVTAVIAFCLANGAPLSIAIQLANIGGGLEVERFGVVAITRDEMRRELLRESGRQLKIVTINEPRVGRTIPQ